MGSRTVGSGKKVKLSVQTSGIDDGEAAEIQVFKAKDNSSLDTLSSKVKNKSISAEWTAKGPDPEGEEQSWEVYYKAKCKGLETKASKLVVYCDWVEVTSVDQDDAALPDACFRVIAGEEQRERNTGSSGVRKEEFLPPGDVTIQWLAPYELIEWVDEKGPKRKAKVKKVRPARLVWPVKGAHTQWINLPEDEAKPEQGHKIKLKVTLEGGKAGDKVYAKLAFGEKNSERNDPKPEFVGGITADWCPDGGIEGELRGDDGAPDCEAELELELGLAGGDTFVVSVGGSEECASESVTITNWRRLYYQVTRTAETKLPALDVLTAALDDVYIKYEQYAEALVAEGDVPAGSFAEAGDVKLPGTGKKLVVGDHNLDQLKAKFQDDKTPVGAHLIFCDAQYDGGESGSWHEQTIEVEAESSKKTIVIADNALYDVFKTAIQNGESCLQSGSTWESLAPSGHADAGKTGNLTAADLNFALPGTPDKLQVVLPADAAAIVANGNKVKLTVKLLVARGPFNGESTEKHQLIVRLPGDGAVNGVMVHELGHAIRQALAEPAPGLSAADHDRTYTEHGHSGHHCGNGLGDEEWSEPDYMVHGDDAAKCIMWGAGSSTSTRALNDGKFCEKCRPFVLAEACDVVNSDGGKQAVCRKVVGADPDHLEPVTPAVVTLELFQEAAALGDPVPLGTLALDVPGAVLTSTPETLCLSWAAGQAKLDPFKPAVLKHPAGVKITKFERHRSGAHLLRSPVGKGAFGPIVKSDPKVDRGGYMFAPADTPDADLTPAWLWKNAKPKQEKLQSIGIQLEGDKKVHYVPVLVATTVAPADRWGAVTLTLKAKLKVTVGSEVREHDLPGPFWEQPAMAFLEDATKFSAGTLEDGLIVEYGNPKAKPPLHARDWVASLSSATPTGTEFRTAVQTATTFVNDHMPAGSDVRITEWEVATTVLTEGGYSVYSGAIRNGKTNPRYSGYSNLGIDSFVTRWRRNERSLKDYTAPTLTAMINKKKNIHRITNEAKDTFETFEWLNTQDACYAVAALLGMSKLAFAADLQDDKIVGPWKVRWQDLPAHVQYFWCTIYFNTGPEKSGPTLRNQGVHYHDIVWDKEDSHDDYQMLEKFNSNWRTATFRLLHAGFPTWTP